MTTPIMTDRLWNRVTRGPGLDWQRALFVGSAAYAGAYAALRFIDWIARLGGASQELATFPLSLAVAVLAWSVSDDRAVPARWRRAWRCVALAYCSLSVGKAAWLYHASVLDVDPTLSWINVAILLFYPLALAGVVIAPTARPSRGNHVRFWLDAATVIVAGAMLAWFLVLRPASLAAHGTTATVVSLAYPAANTVLLLGIAAAILGHPLGDAREPFSMLLLGLLANSVGELVAGSVSVWNLQRGHGSAELLSIASYVLVAASAHRQRRRGRHAVREAEPGFTTRQILSIRPYFAVALGYTIVIAVAAHSWSGSLRWLILGAVTLSGLVVARQVVAARESAGALAESAARNSEARFRALVQHSSDVITILDVDATIRYTSPSVNRMFGYEPETLAGTKLTQLIHPEDVPRALKCLAEVSRGTTATAPMPWRLRRWDGTWLHVENIATNLLTEPTVGGVVLNTRDVTERKALEEQLTHQAFHDPLTNLANRALFRDRVEHALVRWSREQRQVAVLFLDLDNFKTINDSCGHAAGDGLLVSAAERLQACLRASDTAARLGGDEFAILLEGIADADLVTQVAERVAAALQRPFNLAGQDVYVSASIGIASTTGGESADELLRNADVAMYTAKSRGKRRYVVFEPAMHVAVLERLELEADLRRAVERDELVLHYQPIIDLATGRVSGVEALLRWNHPRRGTVSPSVFVPIAEESGLIVPIGRWVVTHACEQARQWQLACPTEPPLSVTVNMSAKNVQQPGLVMDVADALRDSGLPPDSLIVELTESVLMQNTESTLNRLQELRLLGAQLAIDDFGTGYSSLSYLQRYPIDMLKIAKAFVERIGNGGDDSALARVIIALGQTLRLRTVAEGIETAEQLTLLKQLGCDLGQGYFFATPLTRDEATAFLHASAARDADCDDPVLAGG